MANSEHRDILKQGVKTWNAWREKMPHIRPDLSKVDLNDVDLTDINFSNTDLSSANLNRAHIIRGRLENSLLIKATLQEADLSGAILNGANLRGANCFRTVFSGAKLIGADLYSTFCNHADFFDSDLSQANLENAALGHAYLWLAKLVGTNLRFSMLEGANFMEADLSQANLSKSNLENSSLVKTNIKNCVFTGSRIFGISAWELKGIPKEQLDLVITSKVEPEITVDNLEVAQFIYLLLKNEKIRNVIDTITSKVVLILGRFTEERKQVLEALREELRQRNFSPILFDFDKPANRDLTETISVLAHMARFVIADLTNAKSLPQELQAIVPHLPSVPVVPLLQTEDKEYGMFEHFKRYPWVLETIRYNTDEHLLEMLGEQIIGLAETKCKELTEGQSTKT